MVQPSNRPLAAAGTAGLGLLLLLACSVQQATAGVVKPHTHMPLRDPTKLLSVGDEEARTEQVIVAPLDPVCVPKYQTDLVLPPPMPLATRPLGFKEGEEPPKKKMIKRTKKPSASSVHTAAAAEPEAEATEVLETYEFEADESPAVQAEVMARRRKRHGGEDASLDDEYTDAVYKDFVKQNPKTDATKGAEQPSKRQVVPVQDNYHISARQISQQALPVASTGVAGCPATLGPTNVFAYGPADVAGQPFHNWPGFTIEAKRNIPAHIKWTNDLVDENFNYRPHILRDSIDQTLHWANPAGLGGSIDSSPCHHCLATGTCATDPACVTASTSTYTGPVPIVTHVHGQNHVYDWSDGYTEAWYLPNAFGIQGNFRSIGTWYETMEQQYTATFGLTWSSGSATFVYNNTQRASPLWYHDHTLGLTRTNVYAGLAGFYFVRDKFPSLANGPELPGLPYPAYDGVIAQNLVRELPLAIQDRAFTTDGNLFYPTNGLTSPPALPAGDIPPRWIPEFSADVPVNGVITNVLMFTVNGRTYPRHTVYPDAYRLRILNGCNSRTMQLRFVRSSLAQIDPLSTVDTANTLPFWVVGNEGGFYPQLQEPVTTLEMGPAERYDLVLDFSGLQPGQFVFMLNNGPETGTAIYDGTNNGQGLTVNTAQIMRFDVTTLPPGQTAQPFNLAQQVALNTALQAQWTATVPPLVPSTYPIRRVTLMERVSADGSGTPIQVLLGKATSATSAVPTPWTDPVTTNAALDVVQYWDIINLSADSHPIHLHDVDFRFLGRWATTVNTVDPWTFTEDPTIPVTNQDLDPQLIMPCASDPSGLCPVPKDTIIVLPGSTTRIALYGPPTAGFYVWHCHLVEHEDNEMMTQSCFGQPNLKDPRTGQLVCPGPN